MACRKNKKATEKDKYKEDQSTKEWGEKTKPQRKTHSEVKMEESL